MIYNLLGIKKLSLWYDLKILLMTLLTVFGKDYKPAKQVYSTVFQDAKKAETMESEVSV